MGDRLKIHEIYKSIQGESSWSGLPCVFIRLTGCHLRCAYCDSEHAFYDGQWMTLDEILNDVQQLGVQLVEITGGEPLLQPACGALARALIDRGYTVLCETSGSLPIDRLPSEAVKIMDLKCPSSGEVDRNLWSNIDLLCGRDEVKFVIQDRDDYDWMKRILSEYHLPQRCRILVSTVFGALEPRTLVEWILSDNLPVRFQLQLHKLIWSPDCVGV